MATLLFVLTAGLAGGAALALVMAFNARRRARPAPSGPSQRLAPPSPALINMAHIRIEGVGGLGMLAMAMCVAAFEPRIRLAMIVAMVLGVLLGAVLIAWRRGEPIASSGTGPGAHSMLPLERIPLS